MARRLSGELQAEIARRARGLAERARTNAPFRALSRMVEHTLAAGLIPSDDLVAAAEAVVEAIQAAASTCSWPAECPDAVLLLARCSLLRLAAGEVELALRRLDLFQRLLADRPLDEALELTVDALQLVARSEGVETLGELARLDVQRHLLEARPSSMVGAPARARGHRRIAAPSRKQLESLPLAMPRLLELLRPSETKGA